MNTKLNTKLKSKLTLHAALLALAAILAFGTSRAGAQTIGFTANAFTGDADSGISTGNTYTITANIIGSDVAINGVTFTGSGVATSGTNWSLTGVPSQFGSGGVHQLGGSAVSGLFDGFQYNGNPGVMTLSGLTVGQAYTTTFYNQAWDFPGTRQLNVTAGTDSISYNQDMAPGSLLSYTFVASAATQAINFAPVVPGTTFHFYGFSNQDQLSNTLTLASGGTLTLNESSTTTNPLFLSGAGTQTIVVPTGNNPTLTGGVSTDGSTGTLKIDGESLAGASHNLTFSGGTMALGAKSFLVQGNAGNGPSSQTTTLTDVTLTTSGDVGVGRANLVIGGSSNVTVGGVIGGSPISPSADWGFLTIQDSAVVTATGGVNGNTEAWGLRLNGGTLNTPSIQASDREDGAGALLRFNGTRVVATASNASFVTVGANYANTNSAFVDGGGAIFDSNGNNIGIAVNLKNGGGSDGGLTKQGAGTLTLSGANTYNGGTTISAGTLKATNGSALGSGNVNIGGAGALTFDTSGGQLDLNATTITGTGTMNVTGGNTLVFGNGGAVNVNLSAGAQINLLSGYLASSSGFNGHWSSNQASLNVASGAVFGLKENHVVVDALTGGGTLSQDFVLLDGNPASLVVGIANGSGTFSGVIQNGASVLKTGTGTQTLSGANTYTGATTVSAGTLSSTNLVNWKSSVTIASGATFNWNVTSNQKVADTAGNYTVSGAGLFTLSGGAKQDFGNNTPVVQFNMSAGGQIDVTGTNTIVEFGYTHNSMGGNLGSLNVATGAEYRNSDASAVVDALTGGGVVGNAYSANPFTLTVGVSNTVNNAAYGVSSNTATFSGVIKDVSGYNGQGSGPTALIKTGTGTQILSGVNTYTGTTTVNGGKLLINGSISGSVTTVNNGGTLGGNGTVGAVTVASGGTLAPGNSTGILTAASFTQSSGAHLAMQIGGTVAGFNTNGSDGYDRLIVNSTLSIAGDLDGTLLNGYVPTSATYNTGTNQLNLDGTTFYLVIGASSLSGTFANQQAPDSNLTGFNTITFGGQEFAISYTANYNGGISSTFSSGGHDIALMAIPEPQTWAMLLGGFGMLVGFQRLRRKTVR